MSAFSLNQHKRTQFYKKERIECIFFIWAGWWIEWNKLFYLLKGSFWSKWENCPTDFYLTHYQIKLCSNTLIFKQKEGGAEERIFVKEYQEWEKANLSTLTKDRVELEAAKIWRIQKERLCWHDERKHGWLEKIGCLICERVWRGWGRFLGGRILQWFFSFVFGRIRLGWTPCMKLGWKYYVKWSAKFN